MQNLNSVIHALTSDVRTSKNTNSLLTHFASELGWTPSYHIEVGRERDVASIHLAVEHGLENTALITFLTLPYSDLSSIQKRSLINISYNNLVDWHIYIEKEKVLYIYNRYKPLDHIVYENSFSSDRFEALRSESFEKVTGKRPNPNVPALDEALINTIRFWKINLHALLNGEVTNEELSSLFNIIIFTRAVEDNFKKLNTEIIDEPILLLALERCYHALNYSIAEIFKFSLFSMNLKDLPENLINDSTLQKFNTLQKDDLTYLFSDFYSNRHSSLYQYDFSIMSHHALSRIYEKYVAILKIEEKQQLSFVSDLPVEDHNKALGAIYTPQYIARFFARYLKENLSPSDFRNLKTLEPAVGSGIFLRSLLEQQCDPTEFYLNIEEIKRPFRNFLAIDIDKNACTATDLSITLLHLLLTNEFPEKLNILNTDTIDYFSKGYDLFSDNLQILSSFDAVVSNPPYISIAGQSIAAKEKLNSVLGVHNYNRPDLYLAFLKIAIESLKPGGLGLFVIPHSFLMLNSAKKLRQYLYEQTWIKFIADLSAVPVFEKVGIYVILLIFQKKKDGINFNPEATILKCKDLPGKALTNVLKKNLIQSDFYNIYNIDQDAFKRPEWFLLPQAEYNIEKKLEQLPRINDFLEVKQGPVSGNDKVFVRDKNEIPDSELDVWIDLLQDRLITKSSLNPKIEKVFFYPFKENEKLKQEDIEKLYPSTWEYLQKNKDQLLKTNKFSKIWWIPQRLRNPREVLKPKIVTPHLTITPKFALDVFGKYIVSRAPFLTVKHENNTGEDILFYFLAVLNSSTSFWYLSNHSHKYKSGYTMLEVKTLANIPVPHPAKVPPRLMTKLISLSRTLFFTSKMDYSTFLIENELDNVIADIYGLTEEEKEILGVNQ